MEDKVYDALIIGSGAVGVAVAREFTLLGQECLVLEKNPEVISEASSGNTGHLARNFQYTKARAPLEFQMTREAAVNLNDPWIETQINIPRKKCGLVMVAFNDEEVQTLKDYEVKAVANGEDVRLINKEELKRLEPDLGSLDEVRLALYSPKEYVVDSYLMALSNLYVALHYGCQLLKRCRVVHAEKLGGKVWNVLAEKRSDEGGKLSKMTFKAKRIINCGGNYSDEVDAIVPRTIDEPKPFYIKPGLGEYIVFEGGEDVVRRMVTQVPTKSYAGLYIFPTCYGHIAVGPTNVKQDSKEDRAVSLDTVAKLEAHAYKMFPALKERKLIATFAGLRPACADPAQNDYQIRISHDKTFATLGGIRSTGLSASRAIAQYCAKEMFENYAAIPKKPEVVMPRPEIASGDAPGALKLGQFTFKPTHKLCQLGWTDSVRQKSKL